MAQDIVNENQNLSYTNLDFSSIYTEVLDMVKQLTKKWDPSISDESDPGVVLVKLSALLADKCNYNIDKNILEAFPLSVTQDSNARQLYEQLGYYMSWYKAATVPVTINWKTDTLDENGEVISYTIPKFTTITDDNETVVYTLVGTEGDSDVVVSDGILYTDSSRNLNMIAYEGIPTQYTFNDRTTITPNMVDENNRLYLSTAYVFENGIFINNVDQANYAEWHRVDNLYEYSYNVFRYKFGYDSAANLCYLEFPDNYAELFGSGIEIVYLAFSTDESYSDVPAQFLYKFLSTPTVGENNDVALTTDVVAISNTEPATGHMDKEGIDEAYTNYKKVVGTFKTLITLRDYLNYIRSKDVDICSNAFVTDRTNDIQSSYKIVNRHNGVESIITEVERSEDEFQFEKTSDVDVMSNKTYYEKTSNGFTVVTNPEIDDLENYYEMIGEEVLSPFSLKFYLLQKAISLTARGAYDDTFDMSTDVFDMDTLLENTSHLVHTFEDIEPIGENTYVLSQDILVPVDTNGNPTKIYYFYNPTTFRYEPMPVTSLSYQYYNPHAMRLYEADPYYTRSSDNSWYEGKTYYYLDETGTTSVYRPYTQTRPETPPNVYEYEYEPNIFSYIYDEIVEYTITNDTSIILNKTYYEYTSDGQYVVAKLPSSSLLYTDWSNTSYTVTVDADTFTAEVTQSAFDTECVFTFDGTNWVYNSGTVTLSNYGITLSDGAVPINNDTITITYTSVSPVKLGLYEMSGEALLQRIVFFKNKYPISMNISTYNSVGRQVREDILTNVILALYDNLESSNIEFGDSISLDYLTEIVKNADARIKNVAFDALTYTTYAIYWDANQQKFIEIALPTDVSQMDLSKITITPTFDNVTGYLFGKEIICKSILAGTTQLLVPDDTFAYHLNQRLLSKIDKVKYVTGEATIDMNIQDNYYILKDETDPSLMKSYTLQENETITLYRPELSDVETYTSGVHYEYKIFSDITGGSSYELSQNEAFIFYISNVDSEGVLSSFSVYVYLEGAVISPSFDIPVRTTLTTYGNTAIGIASSSGVVTDKTVDSKVYSYTESRNAQVTQINNDSTIANTKIDTNATISAQTLERFTVDESEGYRFMWSLQKPTYDGSLKQYQLFGKYEVSEDEDLINYDSINSYTLKSGEFLYYTDSSMSKLGILGAGTTIFRDCGTTSYDATIVDSDPFIYVNWGDLVDSETIINANGIEPYKNGENINPAKMGLFEFDQSTNKYVRSTATDVSSADFGNYYILLMKNAAGWYLQTENSSGNTIYTPAANPTTSVFYSINPSVGNPTEDINPSTEGLYELVLRDNGEAVEDTYFLINKSVTDSAGYLTEEPTTSIPGTFNRFTKTTDTSLVEPVTFELSDGSILDVTNASTYKNLTIPANIIDALQYSPLNSGWVLKDETDPTVLIPANTDTSGGVLFKEVALGYEDTPDLKFYRNNTRENTFVYPDYTTSQKAYLPLTSTNITASSGSLAYLYYYYVTSSQQSGYTAISNIDNSFNTLNCKPSDWRITKFIQDENFYYQGNLPEESYLYVQQDNIGLVPSTLSLNNDISLGIVTDNGDSAVPIGGFVKITSDLNTYLSGTNEDFWGLEASTATCEFNRIPSGIAYSFDAHTLRANSPAISAITTYTFTKAANSDNWVHDGSTITEEDLRSIYGITIDEFTASEAASIEITINGFQVYTIVETTGTNIPYLPVSCTMFTGTVYINNGSDNVWEAKTAGTDLSGYLSGDYLVSFDPQGADAVDLATVRRNSFTDTENKCICSYWDNVENINSYGKAISDNIGSFYTGMIYLPIWYELQPWFKRTNKLYYLPNTYYKKIYPSVDPFVCSAEDALTLSSNPMRLMRRVFQKVQPNTTLQFTKNQLWTLSEGDVLSVSAPVDSFQYVNFPVFTNSETRLDLDSYQMSYKRVGDDAVNIDKITIKDCYWQGYSNLQINTNTENGQHLLSNQTVTFYDSDEQPLAAFYDSDGQPVYIVHGDNTTDNNVHFQLQYPVSNMTGSFIEVGTSSMTQEDILNKAYIYNVSNDGTDYAFSLDNYYTYVYSKKVDKAFNPDGITIENIHLPAGEYLLPINGFDDVRIEVTYNPTNTTDGIYIFNDTNLPDCEIDADAFKEAVEDITGVYVINISYDTSNNRWVGNLNGTTIDLSTYGITYGTLNINNTYLLDLYYAPARLLTSYVDSTKNYFLGDKLHFAHLVVDDVTEREGLIGTLTVQIKKPNGEGITALDNSVAITVVIEDIFKYSPNELLKTCFDDIKEKLIRLDKDQKYDYTHVPNEDDIIPDPLISKEFWNKNHIDNKFTIAQFNVDEIEYKFIT